MNTPSPVRLGVIGVGSMGGNHARQILDGNIPGAELTAVCDKAAPDAGAFGGAAYFADAQAMYHSGKIDAVLIATPHYAHTLLAMSAFTAGLHVLVEKPLAVTTEDCGKIITAYEARPREAQVFATMFNQRTNPTFITLKKLIDGGELGAIKRINWTITDWFRTDAYYRSGGWRATWAGEGGGVLVNQCPHQLDLFQWFFGLPKTLRGFCQFGADHEIEVEDRVTAYMEFENGATGTFIAATGETPGTNRLEIACDRGKLILDQSPGFKREFRFLRTEQPVSEFCQTTDERFGTPERWDIQLPQGGGQGEQHGGIMKNFVAAIQGDAELIAPGVEGIRGVELCNAMLYSAFIDETVALPIPAAAYTAELQKRIDTSTFGKHVDKNTSKNEDFASSF